MEIERSCILSNWIQDKIISFVSENRGSKHWEQFVVFKKPLIIQEENISFKLMKESINLHH